MTDTTENTTTAADTMSDHMAKYRAHEQLQAELLPRNKAALFDALVAAGITHIIVGFDGYGDSGQIENTEAKSDDIAVAMPETEIAIETAVWGSGEPERTTTKIASAVEQFVYDFLGQTHAGWQDNEGAYGEFTFDVAERTITLDYNERYVESHYHEPVFEEAAMGHCYHHALSSEKKWGGPAEDYLPLHQWFDESKAITADFRHRALRHHAEGIFMLERFFGATIKISTGRIVPVRLIGEQHVLEDLGFIPSFADWVRCIRPQPWMGRAQPIHKIVDPFAADAIPSVGGAGRRDASSPEDHHAA